MSGDGRPLLRIVTAGSVDDGKSTLIGRLLHDANAVYRDQLESVQAASAARSAPAPDFSLLTDGLRAEREQGITIDVGYRYFGTQRRKFIVADVPGHEQYTRNMATGASTADLAVLLMDARKRVLPQTCRHAAIAWLMGIRSFAIVVNKMDLVHFDESVFREVCTDFTAFVGRLGDAHIEFIPCCAPDGDNLVHRSARTPWYRGPALLHHLETVAIPDRNTGSVLRFPVQSVIRTAGGERYCAGRIASGLVRTDDTVISLNSGRSARVAGIQSASGPVQCAVAGQSIAIRLEEDVDVGRGDMLADPNSPPALSRCFRATLLWLSRGPLALGHPYLVKHTTRYVCGSVVRLAGAIDPSTLERQPSDHLVLNEFAEVEIETHQPLYVDRYDENRVTGAFIVVEPITNETVGAGMISGDPQSREDARPNARFAGQGMAVWLTGLSSAGKSSISKAVYEKLWAKGYKVELLDGDIVRQHLSKDLGFTKQDRDENIRRIGFMAELLTRNGVVVIAAAISPYRAIRDEIRARIGNFIEVYVHAPLPVLEERDVKGLYARCRAGEIRGVTGIDDPYEPPLVPEVECRTDRETLAQSADKVIQAVEDRLQVPA